MEATQNVLICVTGQKACERLIRTGYNVKLKKGGELYVIHVAKIGDSILGNPQEGEALDYLFNISKQVGAEMTVLRSNKILDILADYTEKHEIGTMVLGESPQSESESNIIRQLRYRLPHVEFIIVSS